MRAVVLRGGELSVREIRDPVPGPGELLLRILSTAICASDVHFMDHPELGLHDPTGRSLYDAGRDVVLGHEFVGEVIGHGPSCTDQFPVGTRVTSIPIRLVNGGADGARIIGQHPETPGSFAELVVVSESIARAVQALVADDAVALTDAFAVGEFYVRSANLTSSEVPVVIGAGAIGLSAVAALSRRGIEPILVCDYQAERRTLACSGFGAHIAIDPAQQDPLEVVRQVRADRGLWGAPVIFECVGATGLIQKLVDGADMGTRIYCAGGWYTGDTLDITSATRQGVTLQFGGGPWPQDWYGTLDAIADGTLDPAPCIGAVIGLDGVPDAIDLARRSAGPPRIMVHPNGDPT